MKHMKTIGVLALIVGSVSFAIYQKVSQNQIKEAQPEQLSQTTSQSDDKEIEDNVKGLDEVTPPTSQGMSKSESLVFQFIQDKMVGKYGMYTNYLNTSQDGQVATGHEILSESAGLYLYYTASKEMKTEFYQMLDKTEDYLDNGTLFSFRYTPKTNKKATSNAAIDDLRLIRSMYKGAIKFDDKALKKKVDAYTERFVETNINGDQLADFYDSKAKKAANYITLCYIDINALNLLPMTDGAKEALLKNQEDILKNGYLSDDFPLYKTRYDYQKKAYVDSDKINIIESLISIQHLSKNQLQKQETIDFLKEKVANGDLHNSYDSEGKVLDQNQSTAAYALCALIATELNDQQFYQDAMRQINKFQVIDTNSPLYGGFGQVTTNEAFSYDNLMALLAFTVSGR